MDKKISIMGSIQLQQKYTIDKMIEIKETIVANENNINLTGDGLQIASIISSLKDPNFNCDYYCNIGNDRMADIILDKLQDLNISTEHVNKANPLYKKNISSGHIMEFKQNIHNTHYVKVTGANSSWNQSQINSDALVLTSELPSKQMLTLIENMTEDAFCYFVQSGNESINQIKASSISNVFILNNHHLQSLANKIVDQNSKFYFNNAALFDGFLNRDLEKADSFLSGEINFYNDDFEQQKQMFKDQHNNHIKDQSIKQPIDWGEELKFTYLGGLILYNYLQSLNEDIEGIVINMNSKGSLQINGFNKFHYEYLVAPQDNSSSDDEFNRDVFSGAFIQALEKLKTKQEEMDEKVMRHSLKFANQVACKAQHVYTNYSRMISKVEIQSDDNIKGLIQYINKNIIDDLD